MKKTERPLPRSEPGKASRTRTVAEGIISPPPTPCRTRKRISHGTVIPVLAGTSPHINEEPAKISTPATTTFLWPRMSPKRPPRATNAAVESA